MTSSRTTRGNRKYIMNYDEIFREADIIREYILDNIDAEIELFYRRANRIRYQYIISDEDYMLLTMKFHNIERYILEMV